jgi:hypothetical protein
MHHLDFAERPLYRRQAYLLKLIVISLGIVAAPPIGDHHIAELLTEVPNKHCDTLAQAVLGTSEQRLQECLTNMPWDKESLNR